MRIPDPYPVVKKKFSTVPKRSGFISQTPRESYTSLQKSSPEDNLSVQQQDIAALKSHIRLQLKLFFKLD